MKTGKGGGRMRRGFAMVFAIAMVVAVETAIGGSFLHSMSHQRGVQRAADRNQIFWIAEGGLEKAISELSNFVYRYNRFPDRAALNQIETDISDWYSSYLVEVNDPPYANTLRNITLQVLLSETDPPGTGIVGYSIQAAAVKNTTQERTLLFRTIHVTNGGIFDFNVFYNEELEIVAGPSLKLQGPIFSNKKIYLMNDAGNTLTLPRADNFTVSEPQPYVLHSAEQIYFHFKRAVAKNYLLPNPPYTSGNAAYLAGAPSEYVNARNGLELNGSYQIPSGATLVYAPRFYFFTNGADFAANQNYIEIADSSGSLRSFSPPHPDVTLVESPRSAQIIPYTQYNTDGWGIDITGVSITTAIDPNDPPKPSPTWTVQFPVSITESGKPDPPVHPLWLWRTSSLFGSMVQNGVPRQILPLGDPAQSDPHVLIEPLTDVFPPCNSAWTPNCNPALSGTRASQLNTPLDTPELAALKFQTHARGQGGVDLWCKPNTSGQLQFVVGGCSPAFIDLINNNIIRSTGPDTLPSDLYDYRMAAFFPVVEIDLEALLRWRADQGLSDPQVIYVHTYPMADTRAKFPHAVKLINGKRLPRGGLTIASPGRLFIQGDYNTFSYEKRNVLGLLCAESDQSDPNCFCTVQEWESKTCKVPPAAVFSDSFVVLSNDWSNGYGSSTTLANRPVQRDVMVNTALGTGYLPSRLTQAFTCNSAMSNCERLPSWGDFQCPDGLDANGQPNATGSNGAGSCEYYRAADGKYYLNKNSTKYQNALNISGQQLPAWEKIPIFVDAVKVPTSPIPPSSEELPSLHAFYGVSYAVLKRDYVFGSSQSTANTCTTICTPPSGEESQPTCTQSCTSTTTTTALTPDVRYPNRYYDPLYSTKYSGGLENLINFQESWWTPLAGGGYEHRTFRFLGTLSAPWFSKELYQSTGIPKYYSDTYYSAPFRNYDYNETLRTNPPPSTPGTFSVKRKSWSGY